MQPESPRAGERHHTPLERGFWILVFAAILLAYFLDPVLSQ